MPEHLYGADRLLYPARRTGPKGERGAFERISWDEALDLVGGQAPRGRASASAARAILPYYYGGSNGLLTQDATDARLFCRLGASRLARTVCAAPTGAAASGLYGKMPGVALPDYVHARLIVVWGVNPSATGIHLVPVIQEAQRAGREAGRRRSARARRSPSRPTCTSRRARAPTSARARRHPLAVRDAAAPTRVPRAHTHRRGRAARARRAVDASTRAAEVAGVAGGATRDASSSCTPRRRRR